MSASMSTATNVRSPADVAVAPVTTMSTAPESVCVGVVLPTALPLATCVAAPVRINVAVTDKDAADALVVALPMAVPTAPPNRTRSVFEFVLAAVLAHAVTLIAFPFALSVFAGSV